MACVISDSCYTYSVAGTPVPVVHGLITVIPTMIPVAIAIAGAFRLIVAPGATVTTDTGGNWSLTLPTPGESKPPGLQWVIRLPDGMRLLGSVPETAPGPVSLDQLCTLYNWAVVSPQTPLAPQVMTGVPLVLPPGHWDQSTWGTFSWS